MGRPLKLHNSPLRNLAMLRDEFARWAADGSDACFSRLTVRREPMVRPDGSLDADGLTLLSDGFAAGKNRLVVGAWFEAPSMPECSHEFLWARGDGPGDFLDRFDELAESALRSLAAVEGLSARLKMTSADLDENLAWDRYWLDVMLRLGLPGTHPVVRTLAGSLRYDRRLGDQEVFVVGDDWAVLRAPPADVLGRLKKLARAKSRYEWLRCGVLRGSAYAIDWLLQEAEGKGFG
jgi:hypothetical protein